MSAMYLGVQIVHMFIGGFSGGDDRESGLSQYQSHLALIVGNFEANGPTSESNQEETEIEKMIPGNNEIDA